MTKKQSATYHHKFPKQLFVRVENPTSEDEYYAGDETADAVEDGDEVAIYELKEVKTKRVTHALD